MQSRQGNAYVALMALQGSRTMRRGKALYSNSVDDYDCISRFEEHLRVNVRSVAYAELT